MLNHIIYETNTYLKSLTKTEKKKIGQFFTTKNVAKYMANLFTPYETELNILDPGAGSGILSAALLDKLEEKNIDSVNLKLYENDANILPLLYQNMDYLKKTTPLNLKYEICEKNYILDNSFNQSGLNDKKYDLIISNPPYHKISKKSSEAQIMENICYGSPNMYFLFMGMALSQLKYFGESVFIIPRSWTSGAYFKKFREYLFNNAYIQNIHLFLSRNEVFKTENVLQETLIIKLVKSEDKPKYVNITSSLNDTFNPMNRLKIPYELVISNDDNHYVYLPTSRSEIEILEKINKFDYTLQKNDIKLKTGLSVEFRNKNFIEKENSENNVPLFYTYHFENNLINFPKNNGKKQYIKIIKNSLIQKNKDYLFLKRFTSKEENRRLQPAIYLKKDYNEYEYISTDNKVNFIESTNDKELNKEEIYGLFVIFNSTLYDKHYRLLNGNTQVNATEINSMPVPSKKQLYNLGNMILKENNLSIETCDNILESII